VLSVVGLGSTIGAARTNAERAADLVSWQGMQRRHDIAARPPAGAGERAATSYSPIEASSWDKAGSQTGGGAA
jgi:hypothetical protein